jgi:hypothetical protein
MNNTSSMDAETQPKLLVLWDKHDLLFDSGEPERYRKDVPNAEVHIVDAGHFAIRRQMRLLNLSAGS